MVIGCGSAAAAAMDIGSTITTAAAGVAADVRLRLRPERAEEGAPDVITSIVASGSSAISPVEGSGRGVIATVRGWASNGGSAGVATA